MAGMCYGSLITSGLGWPILQQHRMRTGGPTTIPCQMPLQSMIDDTPTQTWCDSVGQGGQLAEAAAEAATESCSEVQHIRGAANHPWSLILAVPDADPSRLWSRRC